MRTSRLSWIACSPIALLSFLLGACGSDDLSTPVEEAVHPATARARASITANPRLVLAGPDDGFVVRDVIVEPDGREHVRFDRTYRGCPSWVVISWSTARRTARSKACRTSCP